MLIPLEIGNASPNLHEHERKGISLPPYQQCGV